MFCRYQGVVQSNFCYDLMTRVSRHNIVSVVITTQFLTLQGRFGLSIRQQCTHFVLFKCFGNQNTLSMLGRHYSKDNPSILIDSFHQLEKIKVDGEEANINYIILDLSLQSHLYSNLRVYTNIFSSNSRYYFVSL